MNRLLLTLLLLCLFTNLCFAGSKAKKEVKRGNSLYNKGNFEEALERYEQALLDFPDSDIVNFDLGTALYKTEDYKKAVTHFEKSLVSEDESLEQKASYNLGNARYKFGISKEDTDLQSAIGLLKQSLHHYERAIELDQDDEDAKYNYEFVKKELERLQEKMKQQQQQKQPQQDKKDSDKQDKEQQQQEQDRSQQEQEKEQQQEQQKDKESGEDKEEQQSKDEEPQQQEGQDEQESKQDGQPEQPKDEMSEQEASMLLDSYRHEEEPRGLYKENIPVRGMPEVLKDW